MYAHLISGTEMILLAFVALLSYANSDVVINSITVLINIYQMSVKGCQRVLDAGLE